MATLYDLPMKYMTGLKTVERSAILESTTALMRGSEELSGRVLEILTEVLNVILEKPTHGQFDRASVQLTARIIACCRATYDSLRIGHLVAANAMVRDVVENFVAYNYLANNQGIVGAWLEARTHAERLKFGFTRMVKSFPASDEEGLRVLYDTFSGEAHTNHLAVSYVRFRLPFGYNFYLSGCYIPNILAAILEACCMMSLEHLENMRRWQGDTPGFQGACSLEASSSLRQEMESAVILLRTEAANAYQDIQATERADNLSNEEITFIEALKVHLDNEGLESA